MPRKRLIDPEFWLNGEISKLDYKTRLLYIGLWNFADDGGVLEYNPEKIKAQIFPYSYASIKKNLEKLIELKKLVPYKVDNKEYLYIKNFKKYQSHLVHPSFRYPSPPIQTPFRPEEKRREEKLREEKSSELPEYKKFKPDGL